MGCKQSSSCVARRGGKVALREQMRYRAYSFRHGSTTVAGLQEGPHFVHYLCGSVVCDDG